MRQYPRKSSSVARQNQNILYHSAVWDETYLKPLKFVPTLFLHCLCPPLSFNLILHSRSQVSHLQCCYLNLACSRVLLPSILQPSVIFPKFQPIYSKCPIHFTQPLASFFLKLLYTNVLSRFIISMSICFLH